jgi:hypothetical protein
MVKMLNGTDVRGKAMSVVSTIIKESEVLTFVFQGAAIGSAPSNGNSAAATGTHAATGANASAAAAASNEREEDTNNTIVIAKVKGIKVGINLKAGDSPTVGPIIKTVTPGTLAAGKITPGP